MGFLNNEGVDKLLEGIKKYGDTKVNKIEGKQLSTEDFTTVLKNKLNSLSNYDDTEIQNAIDSINVKLNTLIGEDSTTAVDKFQEIVEFLKNIENTDTLEGIVSDIMSKINEVSQQVNKCAPENISYVDFDTLVSNKQLVPNKIYRVKNFISKYDEMASDAIDSVEHPYDLIIRAISEDSFDSRAHVAISDLDHLGVHNTILDSNTNRYFRYSRKIYNPYLISTDESFTSGRIMIQAHLPNSLEKDTIVVGNRTYDKLVDVFYDWNGFECNKVYYMYSYGDIYEYDESNDTMTLTELFVQNLPTLWAWLYHDDGRIILIDTCICNEVSQECWMRNVVNGEYVQTSFGPESDNVHISLSNKYGYISKILESLGPIEVQICKNSPGIIVNQMHAPVYDITWPGDFINIIQTMVVGDVLYEQCYIFNGFPDAPYLPNLHAFENGGLISDVNYSKIAAWDSALSSIYMLPIVILPSVASNITLSGFCRFVCPNVPDIFKNSSFDSVEDLIIDNSVYNMKFLPGNYNEETYTYTWYDTTHSRTVSVLDGELIETIDGDYIKIEEMNELCNELLV